MSRTEAFGEVIRGRFPALLRHTLSDATTEPFWEAARQGRLRAPRCTTCGTVHLPPVPLCWVCHRTGTEWIDLPGTGTIYTFTVVRHPLHPDLAEACPYVSGVIELDGTQGAGARLILNIPGADPDRVAIGDRVRIVFDDDDGMPTPRAEMAGGTG